MGAYHTQQQKNILAYLKTRTGQQTSADQLYTALLNQKTSVSKATVYRQLEKLVQQGLVKKYRTDGSSAAYYEYIQGEQQTKQDLLHLICDGCGCISHVECQHALHLGQHIGKDHGFHVNPSNVVLHGVCSRCASK